jgi:hypothetical protein
MENLHDNTINGTIINDASYFTQEPFCYMTNLPKLPQIYIDDIVSRQHSEYGYLPATRENRTPIIDQDCLFQNSKFVKDCADALGGFTGATILRFDPNTVLDWHSDFPRKCGMNFLINEVDGMCHTFIREQIKGWNYKMLEVKYLVGEPILINTSLHHTTYNFHPTKTRLVLSITFGKDTTYKQVKDFLSTYKTVDYN